MLKSLFEILATEYSGLNVFRYLTFRAICSILTALVLSFVIGPLLIRKLNDLNIGETAVWIGVNAGHRDAAFNACRYIIDETKTRVPIWKKEIYVDGDSGWLEGAA